MFHDTFTPELVAALVEVAEAGHALSEARKRGEVASDENTVLICCLSALHTPLDSPASERSGE